MGWNIDPRDDAHNLDRKVATIAFRKTGLAFNTELVRAADVTKATRATLFFDDDVRRVGVRFSTSTDRNTYQLVSDGAGGQGRWIQVTRIYQRHTWLREVLERPVGLRRFPARYEAKSKLWFVEVD